MSTAIIDAPLDDLRWPRCCCRCGSERFSVRTHVESVVIMSVGAVTTYRRFGVPIPVCARCFHRRTAWYGGAAALFAAVLALASQWAGHAVVGYLAGALGLGIVYMLWRGLDAQPVRLVGFAEQTRVLTIKTWLVATEQALLAAPGARPGTWKPVRRPLVIALVVVWLVAMSGILVSRLLA